VIPDDQPRARLELDDAPWRGDDESPDAAFLIDDQVDKRADHLLVEADVLAAQVGEGVAPGAIEAELTIEEDEWRLDGEAVALRLAGRKGEEAVHAVAAPDFEPEKAGEPPVEERVHGGPETHVADDNGPANERAGPVKRRHSVG
jgi:hypothetical protein